MKKLITAVIVAILIALPNNTCATKIKPIHKHCKTCTCNKQIQKPSWLIKNKNTVIACVVCAGLIAGAAYVLHGKKALVGKPKVTITPHQPQVNSSTTTGAWNYVADSRAAKWVTGWFYTNSAQS